MVTLLKNNLFTTLNLRKMLLIFLTFVVIFAVSIIAITIIINTRSSTTERIVSETFSKIKVQLEFKGVDDSIKKLAEDYIDLFGGYCNIIITDVNGKIVFRLNDGYIVEKEKFLVLTDPWQTNGYGSDVAYIIDSKNNIKYSAQLGSVSNINALKETSSKNPLSKILYERTKNVGNSLGDKLIKNSDGNSYVVTADTKMIMDYGNIASKGLNLYSLYDADHQYNNYSLSIGSLNTLIGILKILGILFAALFWIFLPIWVLKDAQKRNLNDMRWAVITVVLNLIGLGIYLAYRPMTNNSDEK